VKVMGGAFVAKGLGGRSGAGHLCVESGYQTRRCGDFFLFWCTWQEFLLAARVFRCGLRTWTGSDVKA